MIEDSTLQLFCHRDEGHKLGSIRVDRGYAYGSNMFALCARRARDGETDHGKDGMPPNLEPVIKTIDDHLAECIHPMDDLNVQLCAKCVGSAVHGENIACLSCHGTGECDECVCGHSHSCGICSGSGFTRGVHCDACNGEGYVGDNFHKDGYVRVLGVEIRIDAAVALSWLNGVKLATINFTEDDLGSLVFTLSEYKGIVLGKRRDKIGRQQ